MGNTYMSERSRELADYMGTKEENLDDLNWGYGREIGPNSWWVHFPIATSENQSPIDIDPEDAEFDPDLAIFPLRICYQRKEAKTLINMGPFCQINLNATRSFIFGGPLKHKYYLKEFHLHWGHRDDYGSEHTVHSKTFAAEIQFVHWNAELYESMSEAIKNPDGLAIISVLLDIAPSSLIAVEYLCQFIPEIKYKGQSLELDPRFDVAALLPNDVNTFWTYKGSLTSPPCSENATWIVFHESLPIAKAQLATLRSLMSIAMNDDVPMDGMQGHIISNNRPVQPIGERKVYTISREDVEGHNFDQEEPSMYPREPEYWMLQRDDNAA